MRNVDTDHHTSISNSGESFDILHNQPGPMNNDAQIGIPSFEGSGVTSGNDNSNTGLMGDINQLYQQQLLHQQNINTSLGGNTSNTTTNYDIANEIKRWQQYHTNNNVLSNTPTALLSNTSSNTSGVQSPQLLDANSTSASTFLQQMIESQQQQRGSSGSRFDIPLAGSFALPGSFGQQQVIGSVGSSGSSSNNNSSNTTNANASSSDLINNSIVNHELFNATNLTDPNIMNNTIQQQIYMMAQQAANLQAVMNYHQSNNNNNATNTNGTTGTNTSTNPLFLSTNPMLFPQHDPLLQQSSSSFAVFPDLVDTNNNNSNINSDLPLPSPHSLFHRDGSRRMRGGVIEPFPEKLHRLLLEVEGAGRSDIISFVSSGRAFQVHKPDKFFKDIVPLYFRQSRLSSFKRQLNLYGFELINTGPSRGGYFHELFIKDQPELCRRMRRVAIKLTAASKVNTFDEDDTNENHCMTPQELYEMQRSNLGISSFH